VGALKFYPPNIILIALVLVGQALVVARVKYSFNDPSTSILKVAKSICNDNRAFKIDFDDLSGQQKPVTHHFEL